MSLGARWRAEKEEVLYGCLLCLFC